MFFFGLFAGTFALKAQVSDGPAWAWTALKLFGTGYFWWIIAAYGNARRRIATALLLFQPPVARAVRIARMPSYRRVTCARA